MDRAVLDAYGWTEAVHDEVLAWLLELNQERYEAEVLAGSHEGSGSNRAGSSSPMNDALPLLAGVSTGGDE